MAPGYVCFELVQWVQILTISIDPVPLHWPWLCGHQPPLADWIAGNHGGRCGYLRSVPSLRSSRWSICAKIMSCVLTRFCFRKGVGYCHLLADVCWLRSKILGVFAWLLALHDLDWFWGESGGLEKGEHGVLFFAFGYVDNYAVWCTHTIYKILDSIDLLKC